MCNAYRNRLQLDLFRDAFPGLQLPGGAPNLEPRDPVRITEAAPIIRVAAGAPELVQARWSWPGPGGKPVYNFRSENRRFAPSTRCLIPADGFYEYTDPPPHAPKRAKKTRWLFTMAGEPWFCIAGVLRALPDGAPAFSMLTVDPGPDVAPYHARQVVVLGRGAWARWLDDADGDGVLAPSPAGALRVESA